MGSPCELVLQSPDAARLAAAARAAESEVLRLEAKYSRYRDDSVTAAINRSAGSPDGLVVDDETAALLDYADVAHRESGGRFDISSGVLRRAWDFRSGQLPSQVQIDALLPLVGWARLRWQRPTLVLPRPGMELDFGGYVKEYAADAAANQCRLLGVTQGYVELGGDVRIVGPQADGRPWRVGIRDPRRPEQALAVVGLSAGGIATSGDYERFMIVDGRRYSHLLDPRTGWPVQAYASVSVMAPQALVAGTASTTAMLLGAPEGEKWLDSLGLPGLIVDSLGGITELGRRDSGHSTIEMLRQPAPCFISFTFAQ